MRRRGFTLIEAVIAMIVLSVAVPATLALVHDATVVRAESAMSTRASWLGSMLCEQILADVASASPELGMTALEDDRVYLDDPDTGLFARLGSAMQDYVDQGLEAAVQIGPLVSQSLSPTGEADQDIYREVVVTVSWNTVRGEERTAPITFLVTDPTP